MTRPKPDPSPWLRYWYIPRGRHHARPRVPVTWEAWTSHHLKAILIAGLIFLAAIIGACLFIDRPRPRHAARAEDEAEDRQTIAWLARIRPRPLADAQIRVAALAAAFEAAAAQPTIVLPARPDGIPHADADQFLPPWPPALFCNIETMQAWREAREPELYPRTLPPLPDLHPGWPGHADDAPTAIVPFDGELTAEQLEEFRQSFRAAVERGGGHPTVLPDKWDISEEEHQAAVADLIERYGEVPPSLQHVIDQGGRISRRVGDEPSPEVQPGTHARTAWLSQAADPAQAGHLQPLWADDTGSFTAICATGGAGG